MIAILEGTISELGVHSVVLAVNGIGYGVLIPGSDAAQLTLDKPTKLFIHEHIKEDAHDLYGFVHKDSKQLFEQLLSVKNVGPKVALAILDIGTAQQVRNAIAGGDIKQLQTAKGVGRRAAEQVVVELRDKVGSLVGEGAEQLVNRGSVNTQDEAVQALVALGYLEVDAQAALSGVDEGLPTEARVKQALKAN